METTAFLPQDSAFFPVALKLLAMSVLAQLAGAFLIPVSYANALIISKLNATADAEPAPNSSGPAPIRADEPGTCAVEAGTCADEAGTCAGPCQNGYNSDDKADAYLAELVGIV